MAKIEREILVPYIESVCSLHMVRRKLSRRKKELESSIYSLKNSVNVAQPDYPWQDTVVSVGRIAAIAYGLLNFWAAYVLFSVGTGAIGTVMNVFGILMLIMGACCVGIPIWRMIESFKNNKYRMDEYNYALSKAYALRRKNEDDCKKLLPGMQDELRLCIQKYNQTTQKLEVLYSANVVPFRYRSIHAAMYLYDWFHNGSGDDIAMALNTFVLEQIKDKLEQIIENQMTIIMNQQFSIAMQQQSMEMQRENSRMLMDKIDRLELSIEEQTSCQKMIAGRLEALEWYSQQDYISNMFNR